jgi:hypothetical protein
VAVASLITLADAVVSTLQGGTFTPAITPERKLLPVFDLQQLNTLTVQVVPGGISFELTTRGPASTDDLIVDVAVIKNITDLETDVPPLLALVEAMVFHLKNNRRIGGATLVRLENQPIYGVKELREQDQFISVLRCTYRRAG